MSGSDSGNPLYQKGDAYEALHFVADGVGGVRWMTVSHLCAAVAPAASQAAVQLTAEQVKALVAKLGDADFKVREAAQKELVQAGPAVLDALEQAAKSDDAEVKQRAAEAIKEIRDAIALAVSQEVAKNYLWSYTLDNGAIGSPVVYGGAAYVIGQDWKLHAVDVKTGKKVWAFDLPVKGMAQVSAGEKVVAADRGHVPDGLRRQGRQAALAEGPRPAAGGPAARGGAGRPGAAPRRPIGGAIMRVAARWDRRCPRPGSWATWSSPGSGRTSSRRSRRSAATTPGRLTPNRTAWPAIPSSLTASRT